MSAVGVLWNSGVMSSIRQDWATPTQLFKMLDAEFHFTLDVCADPGNAKCAEFFTQDALERHWVPLKDGPVWCNPPYGREIGKWVERGYRESRGYFTVVMLLPARTDTQWFHEYCLKGEIRFLRGRLNFDDTRRARAPFPSMIVIFRAKQ
jgi:phage N-6-adenine-methyltransferase